MLLHIPDVLTAEQVAHCRQKLEQSEWVDGRVTAGHQSVRAKDNLQLPEDHPVARELGDLIVTALQNNPLFMTAALPLKVFPPLFNCYQGGQSFGTHVDNAIRQVPGTPHRFSRSDLTYLEYPNGGAVFAAGSICWRAGLSAYGYDNTVSRVTENVLRRFADRGPV